MPSPKTKTFLARTAGWAAFVAIYIALVISPTVYLTLHSGSANGRQAACGLASGGEQQTDLKQIITHSDYWRLQPVSVSGTLSYDANTETFSLRDGALSVPLDTSDCQGIDSLKDGETPVVIKGSVALFNGQPLIEVSELRESVPPFVQIMFSAGFFCAFVLMIGIIAGILNLLHWLLSLIGIVKPKPAAPPEDLRDKSAGSALLLGIVAPFFWILNPVIGAGLQAYGAIVGRDGLRSRKRAVALAGIILCAAGFVVMAVVGLGFNWYGKPNADVYPGFTGSTPIVSTGNEKLEIKPYVSQYFSFSIHQPLRWSVDDNRTADSQLTFNGPEQGTFQNKPFHPQIKTGFADAALIRVQNADDAAKVFDQAFAKTYKKYSSTIENHTLAGGRLDMRLLDATYTDKGVAQHVLAAFFVKNGIAYFIGSSMPAEKWDLSAGVVRASLMSINAWDDTFAACLKRKGATFYGESNCAACNEQKDAFTDGTDRLPYIECQTLDGKTQLDACRNKNITEYPTWEFADGSRLVGYQRLQTLAKKTGCTTPQ